ncbi:putative bifunctional diguanylate cyclase/phosphodiesterase [Croceibacterium xixiisoli]|nr:GGDEF and EAL domain-containing protein [Croceibacterium xixiisoli]
MAVRLQNGLFASVPIFIGGIVNTSVVAAIAAARQPSAAFIGWLIFELLLGVIRITVQLHGRRAIAAGAHPPRLLAALLSCVWAGSLGVGTFLCITSGDWVLATIACLSAAAMVSGMCLRNFGTPRLSAAMVLLALVPCMIAGLLTQEPAVPIISAQLPIFMLTILSASFALHKMLVSWMSTTNELERSESLNETILRSSPDYILILDRDYEVVYCNRPDGMWAEPFAPVGQNWLSMLAEADRPLATRALEIAGAEQPANIGIHRLNSVGERRWLDIAVNRTSDASGRFIVVARDITHQKRTEEKALWMAQHDALTGLPNRTVLQARLDALLADEGRRDGHAMLILDVDHFKSVNDTLGHDAGDKMLCILAQRLGDVLEEQDLVTRTGGDEFALVIAAPCEAAVEELTERIFDRLREPVSHGDRLLDCSVSIGASLLPASGGSRSEVMKAADIALYAAKAAGRGQLRIFEPQMMLDVEQHQTKMTAARQALKRDAIEPHYQPKVALGSSRIVGFEALLRWRDRNGRLCGPDGILPAFEDPSLGEALSEMMLRKVLDDIVSWRSAGVEFEHVAINVAGGDFRRGGFVETIPDQLLARSLPSTCLQIEVTENVFLGQCAQEVEQTLRKLSNHGVRIALDDFGTGYASLSHLNQFPVDLLKIDRSFTEKLGSSPDAEAIAATVINLGHCFGMEVVAEGVETPGQEAILLGMGCDTGQGYLYAPAMPADDVPAALAEQDDALRA